MSIKLVDVVMSRLRDQGYDPTLAGSMRRGKSICNDANILVASSAPRVLESLFMLDSRNAKHYSPMTPPHKELLKDCISFKFMNFPFHILCCQPDEWGAALLYWTGSLTFTTAIRREAKSQGFLLNRHGLYFNGDLIAGKTEEQIFFALGIDFMPPHERS